MTLEQAKAIMSDGRYVRGLIGEAIDRMQRTALEEDAPTPESLGKRKAIIQGLRIAENFYTAAEAKMREAKMDEEEEAEERDLLGAMMPPGLVTVAPTVPAAPEAGGGS